MFSLMTVDAKPWSDLFYNFIRFYIILVSLWTSIALTFLHFRLRSESFDYHVRCLTCIPQRAYSIQAIRTWTRQQKVLSIIRLRQKWDPPRSWILLCLLHFPLIFHIPSSQMWSELLLVLQPLAVYDISFNIQWACPNAIFRRGRPS